VSLLRVVSLFSGCGGADLGILGGFRYLGKNYSRNDSEIVHASDFDKSAVQSYNANFSHKAEHADIRDLEFSRGMADIVVGGFPCQSFSTVNPTKIPGAKETQLFWEMARVLEEIRPKAFIAENVKGFYTLEGGKYFKLAEKAFKDAGYDVFHQVMNATEFGIPQKRQRLIIVGIRKDLKAIFKFPNPTHGEKSRSKKSLINLEAVIQSLVPSNDKYFFSEKAVQGAKNAKPNMKRALAQNLQEPCLTITSHLAKVSINSRDPVLLVDAKKELYRRFTPREAASIQSFPDKFTFPVSETQAYKQIGNAIPPVLMWHIFQSLQDCLEGAASQKYIRSGSLKKSA
jgi:DNA (cytosine-5)-methyltransferase 1